MVWAKNCGSSFGISKYAFLIFGKGDDQKIAPGFLGFVSMVF